MNGNIETLCECISCMGIFWWGFHIASYMYVAMSEAG